MFGANTVFFKFPQSAQTHIQNRIGLHLRQLERFHQIIARLVFLADDADNLIQIEIGNQITVQHFKARGNFIETILRFTHQHDIAMRQPLRQHFAQPHDARHTLAIQHIHIQREAAFQIGLPIQHRHHLRRIKILTFRLNDDANILSAFITNIIQHRQLPGIHQLGDFLNQARFLNLIGNFGDDDLPSATAKLLNLIAGAHPHGTAPGGIGFAQSLGAFNTNAAGRKIRPFDIFHQRINARIGCFQKMQGRRAKLVHIMRRNTGRHAHGNTRCAIGQEVRKGRRQHNRLGILTIISVAKINRVAIKVLQQQTGNLGHARLGVTHGGGVITIHIAEIALPIHQRIAHCKILRQTHQSIIDGLVAMRMIAADNIADNAGRFLKPLLRVKAQLAHGKQQAAMHGLQPVAHIR